MKIITDIAELIKVLGKVKSRKHWRVQPRAEGLTCEIKINKTKIHILEQDIDLSELPEQWPRVSRPWKGEVIMVPDMDNPVINGDASLPMESRCIQELATNPIEFLSSVQPYLWNVDAGPFMMVPQAVKVATLYQALAALSTIDREMMVYGWAMEGISIVNGNTNVLFIRPPREALTRLERMEFGISRVGMLTALAVFEPVVFNGLMVSQTAVHGYHSLIFDHGIRSGDLIRVCVRKTGQHTSNVIEVGFPSDKDLITLPNKCPSCNAVLIQGDTIKCSNYYCEGVLYRKLLHFCAPENMAIKGIGKRLADVLITGKLVATVDDLYALDEKRLSEVVYASGISVPKILSSINESRVCKLDQVIRSLSISGIGNHTATLLAWLCGELFNLVSLYNLDISKWLPDLLNEATRKHLEDYLSVVSNQRIILSLSQELVTTAPAIVGSGHEYVGKRVAIVTGPYGFNLSYSNIAELVIIANAMLVDNCEDADYIIVPQDIKGKVMYDAVTVALPRFLLDVLA